MKVFISWSGEQAKSVAVALKAFLPNVLANKVHPFLSSDDIQKGQRSLSVIAEALEDTDFGIVILTAANQHAPWVNFESGAISRSLAEGRVAPVLVDLTQTDVTGPLAQFQMTSLASETDVIQLVTNINDALAEPLPSEAWKVLFTHHWPTFNSAITSASTSSPGLTTTRTEMEILEDILAIARSLDRRIEAPRESAGQERVQTDKIVSALGIMLNPERILFHPGVKPEKDAPTLEVKLREESPKVDEETQNMIKALASSEHVHVQLARGKERLQFFPDGSTPMVWNAKDAS